MNRDTRAARNVAEIRKSGREKEAEEIEAFLTELRAKGLSQKRIDWYSSHLKGLLGRFGGALLHPTKEDVNRVLADINDEDYSDWTKQNYRVALKAFLKWLLGDGDEYPDVVKHVKTTVRNNNKLPKILKPEEVEAIIAAARNPRDAALFSLVADTGVRIGEALGLKVEDVTFDRHGALLRVRGKTGDRPVRCFDCLPELVAWRRAHPQWEEGQAVFVLLDGSLKPLEWAAANKVLKLAAKRAGIKRRVHFHQFRHTAATKLAPKVSEPILEKHYGWTHGSRMPQVYLDLAHEAVDEAVLRAHGVEPEEEEPSSVGCPRCSETNPARAAFCFKCGMVLDPEAVVEGDTPERVVDQAHLEALRNIRELAKEALRSMPQFKTRSGEDPAARSRKILQRLTGALQDLGEIDS